MQRESVNRPVEILLIEDNAADVTLVREGLSETNVDYSLSVAVDGEQALQFLRREGSFAECPQPDLILLDLNLPKRLGTDVLRSLKQDPALKHIPVLVYTSSGAAHDINAAYEFGANAYLRKPRDLDEVYDMMRTIEHFWLNLTMLPRNQR